MMKRREEKNDLIFTIGHRSNQKYTWLISARLNPFKLCEIFNYTRWQIASIQYITCVSDAWHRKQNKDTDSQSITCYSISERQNQKWKSWTAHEKRERDREREKIKKCVHINVGQPMESWTALRLIEWNTIPSVFNFVFFSFRFVFFSLLGRFFSLAQSKFNCTYCISDTEQVWYIRNLGHHRFCHVYCLAVHKKKTFTCTSHTAIYVYKKIKRASERKRKRENFKQKMNRQVVFIGASFPIKLNFPSLM